MMEKAKFLEKWKHEFYGVMLDCLMQHSNGAALSLAVTSLMEKVDRRLSSIYADLSPDKAPINGAVPSPVRKA